MIVQIVPSEAYPDVQGLSVEPDEVPNYVYVEFLGGELPRVSMAATWDAADPSIAVANVLAQLGLTEASGDE